MVLSARLTYLHKVIFPAVFAMGSVFLFAVGDIPQAVLFTAGTAYMVLYSGRVKEVELSNGHLNVSNGFREVRVPLDNVRSVDERRLLYPPLARIYLKSPIHFGQTIMFHPRGSSLFHESRAVSELRAAIESAR